MGRTIHRIAAVSSAALSIVATVMMSRALLSHGEVETVFLLPKENGGVFVSVLACVMFVPPLLGLAMLSMAWRKEPIPALFPASMAVLSAAGAWFLGETAPRGWLLGAAAAFAITAVTAPKLVDPNVVVVRRTWWRTGLGLVNLPASVAVAGARMAPFFNGSDVSAAYGKHDYDSLLGQIFFVPTVAIVFLIADGVRIDRFESSLGIATGCAAAAAMQIYWLRAPFPATVQQAVVSAVLFAAAALATPGLFSARRVAPTPP
ncbi:MAG: hypothetical protein QM723_26130 [Myxococcaceae bacterium]